MIRIGSVLAAAGHDVISWAPERFRERIEAGGMRSRAHDPLAGDWAGATNFATRFALATERSVEGLVTEILAEEVDLVVHDTHALWGMVAAEFLGLPRLVSYPLFPPADADHPAAGWGMIPASSIGRESLEELESIVEGLQRRWGVELESWRAGFFLTTGPTVVCPTAGLLTGREELAPGWHYVGPLMKPAAPGRRSQRRPLVYVAFGTLFSYSLEPFATAIEALSDEAVDVFVAAGDASVRDRLGPLPPNVSVRGYVDSRATLARANVHVTHAGAGSVQESLLAGVPMVCVPQGADNANWADRVADLGAGEIVRQDADAIRAAVRRLLEDERPTLRAEELGRRLAAFGGADRLLRVTEQILAVEA
jgi:MGT family glycosyltransferase